MRIFGLEVSRAKAAQTLNSVDGNRGWWPVIRESFAGAWQRNVEVKLDTALSNPALFRCISLISSDISKMRLCLVSQDADGIWSEASASAFSPVLRKPNHYQNRIQFYASWVQSKLACGNTYVLKERDARGVVVGLYVLDPARVKPLVAPNGEVFYQIFRDDLSGVEADIEAIPASEIIHDRWNTLYHPLVGLSPIYACGLAALQAQEIQNTSTKFFRNGAKPGGILTAPGAISDTVAERLKATWKTNFTGDKAGEVAVLGDGLTYVSMSVDPVDAQLIEQLKWSGETVCGCFGVPPYMAGVGPAPLNNNVEALAQQYYSQCLQIHIESIELCLDEGLGIGAGVTIGTGRDAKVYGTEFDLDALLRMDSASQIKSLGEGVTGGIFKPDEARAKMNLPPVPGGDVVYLQQQNYSLPALAKRDAKDDPFGSAKPAPAPAAVAPDPAANDDLPAQAAKALVAIYKGFA